MKGGELNARHEEVGGDESPGKLSPPRLTSLIERYALNLLDEAISSCAFSFKEGLQTSSERRHWARTIVSARAEGWLTAISDTGHIGRLGRPVAIRSEKKTRQSGINLTCCQNLVHQASRVKLYCHQL